LRITSKGQVTIPARIREKAGLLPHTEVDFMFDGNEVRIVHVPSKEGSGRGAETIQRLRGSATVKMSTDAIMAHTREA